MSPGLRGLWGLLHESPPLSLCFAPVRPGSVPPLSLFGFAPVRLSGELPEPPLGGERAVLPVGAQSLSLQDRIKQIPLACDKKTTGNAALLGHQKQRPARHAGDHIGTDPGHLLKHPSRVLLDSEVSPSAAAEGADAATTTSGVGSHPTDRLELGSPARATSRLRDDTIKKTTTPKPTTHKTVRNKRRT